MRVEEKSRQNSCPLTLIDTCSRFDPGHKIGQILFLSSLCPIFKLSILLTDRHTCL